MNAMKLTLFMAIALAMTSTTTAKHHMHMKGGKGKYIMKTIFTGMMLYMKETETCPNPVPMLSKIYGLFCDTDGCAENAPICLNALMPVDDNACRYVLKCIPDLTDGEMRIDMSDKKDMAECVMRSCMESKGLEYMEGDMKSNILAILGVTVGNSPILPENTKTEMMAAVLGDTCVAPGKDFNMMEEMRFKSCLLKTCVRSLSAQ